MSFARRLIQTFGQPRRESEVHAHVPQERAELFRSFDGGSTELESLNFIHALVLIYKPQLILETGTGVGFGTIALAAAAAENGFGQVITLETHEHNINQARAHLAKFEPSLPSRVTYHQSESIDYIRQYEGPRFEFGFFDSDLTQRHTEFQLLKQRGLLAPGAVCVFHDTSRLRGHCCHDFNPALIEALDQESLGREWLELPFGRGLRLIRLAGRS